jgi:prepilin-type N-terminal cleavage/methylation domain-containing protein
MLRRTVRQRGFTLIEVVVTAAFVGIVVLAIDQMFVALRQVNREADQYTIATEVAQQLVEQYRNLPYTAISTGTTDVTSSALSSYPSLKSPRSATITVTQVDPNGLKQLDVAVSYTDRTGTKNVQFETVVSNKGINH